MKTNQKISKRGMQYFLSAALLSQLLFSQCKREEDVVPDQPSGVENTELPISAAATYTIKANQNVVDGSQLKIQPGTIVKIEAGNRGPLLLKNFIGTAQAPIVFVNGGGKVNINSTASYGLRTTNCKFFKVTGSGSSDKYGITVNGGKNGVMFDGLSTNFEVNRMEVKNTGFAGIMAKTDPSCDPSTWRGNFVMQNLKFYDNYIHDVKGEGFYIGNSFFFSGRNLSCGLKYPHEIRNVEVFNNQVTRSGCEGIQVGCVVAGMKVYNNKVENFGVSPFAAAQNNGIQIGEGSTGEVYNNFISNGPGNGIIMLGKPGTSIYNNLILNPGSHGSFVDNRGSGTGEISFINNTIINPGKGGIKNYNEVAVNKYINNIIVSRASYYLYGQGAKAQILNNYTATSVTACQFVNATAGNYRLKANSPCTNKGRNTHVQFDLDRKPRPSGISADIGAYEVQQ